METDSKRRLQECMGRERISRKFWVKCNVNERSKRRERLEGLN